MQTIDTLEAYWHDICNIPRLTQDEERSLAIKIQQGDERALDRLVTANLRLVVSLARQYSGDGVAMSDLISEGNIALINAARKWDPERSPAFVSYAVHDVQKAMSDALATQGEAMTMPKRDVEASRGIRHFSTDTPVHPGQTNTLGDLLRAGKPDTDDSTVRQELSYVLAMAMRSLNEREHRVISAYYGLGTKDTQTMAEIGQEMDLKRERVRQIRKSAERKMRKIMMRHK